KALKAQLDMGPLASLGNVVSKANSAYFAWTAAAKNPIAAVKAAFEATDTLLSALGLDTVNQKISSLEKEAGELAWKRAVDKFKLAQGRLKAMVDLLATIGTPLKNAKEQYVSLKTNVPLDFDKYNAKGQFQFKAMTALSKMLA